MHKKLPPQIVGNIGLFHVCRELSRRGFNVVPTSRNTKAVDVIVGNSEFSKNATVQIKSSTTNIGTRICSAEFSKEEVLAKTSVADFWVFVQINKKDNCKVKQIAVCRGGDAKMLNKENKDWWYSVWRPKEFNKNEWEAHRDDGGWQLIIDYLK